MACGQAAPSHSGTWERTCRRWYWSADDLRRARGHTHAAFPWCRNQIGHRGDFRNTFYFSRTCTDCISSYRLYQNLFILDNAQTLSFSPGCIFLLFSLTNGSFWLQRGVPHLNRSSLALYFRRRFSGSDYAHAGPLEATFMCLRRWDHTSTGVLLRPFAVGRFLTAQPWCVLSPWYHRESGFHYVSCAFFMIMIRVIFFYNEAVVNKKKKTF